MPALTECFPALGRQDWAREERRQAKRKTYCPPEETGAHKERSQLEPVLLQVCSGPCPAKSDMEPQGGHKGFQGAFEILHL